ncbi:MAG: hypothetical protein PHF05_00040 [Candidatus Izemoplasmatales bacterium]|nr:hypothetical protein [Candidatus Izemoplasmatales bacterium]
MGTSKFMMFNVDNLIFLDKTIEEVFIEIKNQMNERLAELEKLMAAEPADQKRIDELKSEGFDLLSELTKVLIDGLNEGTIDFADDDDYDDQVILSA